MNAIVFLVFFVLIFWALKGRDNLTNAKAFRTQVIFQCGVSVVIIAVMSAIATKHGYLELGLLGAVTAGLVFYFSIIPVGTRTKYAYIISSLVWLSVAVFVSKHELSFAIDGLISGTSAVTAYNIHKYFKQPKLV